jgi:hypothetical protein
VQRVLVSVAKIRGRPGSQTCAFLTKRGTLAPYGNCRRPVLLLARGTAHWSITLTPHGLPPGSYRVVVRGIDASGNKERPTRHRNLAAFKVR